MPMLTGLLFDPFALKNPLYLEMDVWFCCFVVFLSCIFFNYLACFMLVTWCYVIPISICKLNHRCVTNSDSK